MIAACVPTMWSQNDHAWRAVVTRSDDDHGSGTVAVVVGVRVARVIRSADDKLSGEVGVSKTQRHAYPRLGGRDTCGETNQESENDEDGFHRCLLGVPLAREDACHAGLRTQGV